MSLSDHNLARWSWLVLVLGLGIVFLAANSVISAATGFPDVPGHQYEDAITYVEQNNIVQGAQDGKYYPDVLINRAEFTKIIVGATVATNPNGSNCFPDVTTEWFAPYVCTAKDENILQGYSDGTFGPMNNVTFAEALKISENSYQVAVNTGIGGDWWEKYLDFAANNGLSFTKDVNDNITRGEMAEIIYWLEGYPQLNTSPQCAVDADCPGGEVCDTAAGGICVPPGAETACADGLDNDNDGTTDCGDQDCAWDPACSEVNCTDGIDDDGDGDTDCADSDCGHVAACKETNCTDGLDDEGDGDIDCNDLDCAQAPHCMTCMSDADCYLGSQQYCDGALVKRWVCNTGQCQMAVAADCASGGKTCSGGMCI